MKKKATIKKAKPKNGTKLKIDKALAAKINKEIIEKGSETKSPFVPVIGLKQSFIIKLNSERISEKSNFENALTTKNIKYTLKSCPDADYYMIESDMIRISRIIGVINYYNH